MICLTIYKNSLNTYVEVSENIPIESSEMNNENILSEIIIEDNTVSAADNQCVQGEKHTDKLTFSDAFKYYRDCNNNIFKWNGLEYTTLLKKEVINNELDKNHPQIKNKLDLVSN